MPKVSVIMGVYNCKNLELLQKSIESIINQSYHDWEFIICNDGSTNDTGIILEKYEKLDERIHIINNTKNAGLSNALNKCLARSKGIYIARQDDDDISYPDRLQQEVEFLDKNLEYKFVGSIADVYDDNGIWGTFSLQEKPLKEAFYWASPFLHPSIMIRREVMDLVGGYNESPRVNRCEDYFLFMKLYSLGCLGFNIQEKLYKYRIQNRLEEKYRSMKDRKNEAYTRFVGYKLLGILIPKGLIYVAKPLLIGMIPQKVFYYIRRRTYLKEMRK